MAKKLSKKDEKILWDVIQGKSSIYAAALKLKVQPVTIYIKGYQLLKAHYNGTQS